MKKMSGVRKIFLCILTVALICVLVFLACGDRILIYIAPKAVLSSALNTAIEQLEVRFKDNPLLYFAEVLGWEGKYHAVLKAKTSNDLLGEIGYDMTVDADMGSNRVLAEGKVRSVKQDLDIKLYLDNKYMAMSSDDLLKGSFYGITYDSFAEDIRSFPLITYIIPDSAIREWENSVSEIQQTMSCSYELPQLPNISEDEINTLLLGIIAMPGRVSGEDLLVKEEIIPCRKISYSASGIYVEELLNKENAAVSADFYLHEDKLLKICVNITANKHEISISLLMGEDLLTCPLLLQYCEKESGVYRDLTALVSTEREDDAYCESWSLHKTEDGREESTSFSFEYDVMSGDMLLRMGQEPQSAFRLLDTSDGIQLESDDILGLLKTIRQEKIDTDARKVSGMLKLSKGTPVASPAYKNLDMWSLEDLLVLLGGIGSLIGLNFVS